MSLKDYQEQIDTSLKARNLEKIYWHPLSQLARLSEEVGEVARIINHQFGEKPKKPGEEHEMLEDELADVLYTVLCMANSQGINLDEPLLKAITKSEVRDKDRFTKKSTL